MDRLIVRTLLVGMLGIAATESISQEAVDTQADPDIVISTGVEGGGYWSAGQRLQDVVEGMGVSATNLTSTGSLANLDRLADTENPVNLAFAQADALQHFLNAHPKQKRQIEELENIGQECVFILTGSNSGIDTDKDLQRAKNLRLGIASASSGIAVTFDYMKSLVPELADIDVVYADTATAMSELQNPQGALDAIMVVHRPREHSAEVDTALDEPDDYTFVQLRDARLATELEADRQVYRSMNLAMPGREKPVKTICVRGLLLANKSKLNSDLRNALEKLVDHHWMRVYATP